MNTPLRFFLSLLFASLITATQTSAQATADSIEVKGKAVNGGDNVHSGDITVTRNRQYSFLLCTDTAGNFSFKIPEDKNDTSKVIVQLHYVLQSYWIADVTQAYTIEELRKGITIATTIFHGRIQQGCAMRYYYYFDPPGKMTLTGEEINR